MTNSRFLLVSDFTIEGLIPHLEPEFQAIAAPFGQISVTLLDPEQPCWQDPIEHVFVWTRPQAVSRSYFDLTNGESKSFDDTAREIDEFVLHLRACAKRVRHIFVATWTRPTYERGLGLLDMDPEAGHSYHLMRMNTYLADQLSTDANIHLLNADPWIMKVGSDSTNPKLWFMGKMAFDAQVLRLAARDLSASVRAIKGETKKLIILDLDNTLWGGIVGDIGWENLSLGGHDPIGESFVEFQKALKVLTRRGIMLAIASKNTESIALEAIDSHPEMVLRRPDFVNWRINWDDKAQNIFEMVQEINIVLNSVVFIDDSPVERERVKHAIREIFVPEWPVNPMMYVQALSSLECFDSASISAEDRARTEMYASEQRRTQLKARVSSAEDYYSALDLRVTYSQLQDANLKRATQLLNKTNQMNLATRRMSEKELSEWHSNEENTIFTFEVTDRFGSYGLTGLAGVSSRGNNAEVTDFVVSCRVIGRGVEQAMLSVLIEHAASLGKKELEAEFHPTEKNDPCRRFFRDISKFEQVIASGQESYNWDLSGNYESPAYVTVEKGQEHAAG
jgi:FkbH-like protein